MTEQSLSYDKSTIDFTTIIGIILTIILIIVGITIDSNIRPFINLPSFIIVLAGTFLITTSCFSFKDIIRGHITIAKLAFTSYEDASISAANAVKMAIFARKNGINTLEDYSKTHNFSKFLIQGIELIADQTAPEEIEKLFTQEIIATAEQQSKIISILRKSAEVAPAMGLIGTIIGLVQMLSSLNDMSKIGPAMAIALLTTFYGTILAYVVFFPLASKLEDNAKERILVSKIYLKALLSVSKGENPRILEKQVNSMISPSKQINIIT